MTEVQEFKVGDKVKWKDNHKDYAIRHTYSGSYVDTSEVVMVVTEVHKGNTQFGQMVFLQTLLGNVAPTAYAYRFELVEAFEEPKKEEVMKLGKGDLVTVAQTKDDIEYFQIHNRHIHKVEDQTFRITKTDDHPSWAIFHLETLDGQKVESVFQERVVRAELVEAAKPLKTKKEKKVKNVKMANGNKMYAVVMEDSGYLLGLRADRESARELKAISGGAKAGVVIQQYVPSKIIR
ncbi:hypothetical protein [Pseudomonas helleri]|uniref:hypothetical protein n=1 Tax=Pseudomonas helleri TaxID=1608996 RepID=UPI00242F77A7|nr:hypothetical protein [Pseudomonas helleri]